MTVIKNVVILGGGSAGWLSAAILAAKFQRAKSSSITITLIESPDVATIGVGEGTWPTMRMTLKKIGISEAEFLSRCNASFKQGSKFVNWRNGSPNDSYYHPFTLPANNDIEALVAAWRQFFPSLSFDDIANAQKHICEHAIAPKLITSPEYGGAFNYGYHLDAAKFAELLREHCTEKLGVIHLLDHVTSVETDTDGSILALQTRNCGKVAGDLFIDCSGSAGRLIGEHFQIPFVSQQRFSINDAALAAQIPYAEANSPIASATISTAQSAGWIWDIGLSSRRGVGYVYSSAHIDDTRAEEELRAYLARTADPSLARDVSVRKLNFTAGHRQQFWVHNCVAVGMSAGFIEPLEASALALIELSVNMIRDEFPATKELLPLVAARFNRTFHYRWERIIQFLKLHYALSARRDTQYWRDVTAEEGFPQQLHEDLALWHFRPPYFRDFIHAEEVFPAASYQYVFYGMKTGVDVTQFCVAEDDIKLTKNAISTEREKLPKYLQALPTNRQLLSSIAKHGLQKI